MTKHTLSDSVKEKLFAIKPKIQTERNPAFYSPEDYAIMGAAYKELTGKNPCWSCSGFLEKIRLSLNNYFAICDKEEMAKVVIEDRVLKPVELTTEPIPYEYMTLKELRGLFPNIKSNSKEKFIKKIQEEE